jgi:hypothetical protein
LLQIENINLWVLSPNLTLNEFKKNESRKLSGGLQKQIQRRKSLQFCTIAESPLNDNYLGRTDE